MRREAARRGVLPRNRNNGSLKSRRRGWLTLAICWVPRSTEVRPHGKTALLVSAGRDRRCLTSTHWGWRILIHVSVQGWAGSAAAGGVLSGTATAPAIQEHEIEPRVIRQPGFHQVDLVSNDDSRRFFGSRNRIWVHKSDHLSVLGFVAPASRRDSLEEILDVSRRLPWLPWRACGAPFSLLPPRPTGTIDRLFP
jgi:hypothetical protein